MPTKARTDTPTAFSFTATVDLDLEGRAAPNPEVLPPGEEDGRPKLPRFSIKGYTGAVMNVAGFYSPVIVDLAGLKAKRQEIPVLLDHDISKILGQTDSIGIGAEGVDLAGIITGEDADAQKVKAHAKNGFKWQASIGASIVRQEYLKPGEKATVNGREVSGPLLIAREASLKEITITALGADDQTTAAIAASDSLGSKKGAPTMFEQWLAAKGFTDPAAISDTQRTFLQAMYDAEEAEKKKAPAVGSSIQEIVATRQKEDDRQDAIRTKIKAAIDRRPVLLHELGRMGDAAIAAGSQPEELELEIYRLCDRANVTPGVRSSIDVRNGAKMLEAAICRAARLPNIEKHYKEDVLTASEDRFPRGLGLVDFLVIAARERGFTGHLTRTEPGQLLQAAGGGAGGQMIRANDGFSTLSIPGILSNIANKFLMDAFNAVEAGWREVSEIGNVNDFKTKTTYALTGAATYEKVGPAGELKHATLGETTYTNKAETFGKMFAITRTDIVNDDLGALTKVPMRLGRGAALSLNEVFWTEFLADAGSFYTSGNKNVSTGAGSALSDAGLTAAQLKFRKQTDPDGKPLGLTPKILLVPPELEITANQLMTSLIVNTGGSSTETRVPNNNTWANKYRTVVSSYLSNANFVGYSAAAWYLIADPADLPLIEVVFLNGRETPIVESADADFNTLGIQFRGYHDFGVKKQEPRAAVRSSGS